MSTSQIRAVLHHKIDQIDDRFIRFMYIMAEAYLKEQEDEALELKINSIPPNPDWKPLTEEELAERLQAAIAEVERGEYISLEDLRKESEKW